MATGGYGTRVSSRQCSIHLGSFKNPKLLPCFHTFCLECLDQYVRRTARNGKFTCPECRSDVTLPPSGVAGFQRNFYIDETSGGNGNGSIAGSNGQKESQNDVCPKHYGELLRFYCKQDGIPICRDCKLATHEGHPTVDLDVHLREELKLLDEMSSDFVRLARGFDRKFKEMATNKQQCISSFDKVINDVNREAEGLITEVNAARQAKIQEIQKTREEQGVLLDNTMKQLKQDSQYARSQATHCTCPGRLDVLDRIPQTQQRLINLKKTSHHVFPLVKVSYGCKIRGEFSSANVNRALTSVARAKTVEIIKESEVFADSGSIDFMCCSDRGNSLLIGVMRNGERGKCAVMRWWKPDTALVQTNYEMSKVAYDEGRRRGVYGILSAAPGTVSTELLKQIQREFKLNLSLHSDTRNGFTCTANVQQQTVEVVSVKGKVELILSSLPPTSGTFSPSDVCWIGEDTLGIVDIGSNSLWMFSPQTKKFLTCSLNNVTGPEFTPTSIAVVPWGWFGASNYSLSLLIGSKEGKIRKYVFDKDKSGGRCTLL